MRSLGQKGIPVVGADSDRLAVTFFSRYCVRRMVYTDPRTDEDAFVGGVLNALGDNAYDMVVPMFDRTLLPLARRKDEVSRLARFPFLDYESLMQGRDKARTVLVADRCGLRVPTTRVVHSESDVEAALADIEGTVLIRPRESEGSAGVRRVVRREEAVSVWREVAGQHGPSIVQSFVPWGGFTYDVDVLMGGDCLPRAVFVAKRIRTYPPLAGPTSCGQGVRCPELAEMAVHLLKEMRWTGPAEVEFRIDPRDGRPTLMEVNPRLWGSLYTAQVAGVDFPYLLYRMAMDGDVEPVTEYRTDRRARYLFTLDLLCMATHPARRSIAREWLGDFFNPRTSTLLLSWRDPWPFFGKLLASLVYGALPSRRRNRLAGARQRSAP